MSVSQTVLEREYYMVDLPHILRKKTQVDAEKRLISVQIAMAPNMGQDAFEEFIEGLRSDALDGEITMDGDDFDADALARLRGKIG